MSLIDAAPLPNRWYAIRPLRAAAKWMIGTSMGADRM
jgi:hypothetical protein